MKKFLLAVLTVVGCAAMAYIESVLRPIYPIKSALKWIVFAGCAVFYLLQSKDRSLFRAFGRPDRRSMALSGTLAGSVFVVIIGGFLLLSPWLDLSAITGNLGAKEGITAATFPFVALYISFGNSFLEEFFFRGFAFLTLRESCPRFAWLFSALAFSLYHVSIMDGWFSPALFLLLTAALAVAGLLFNWLDRKGTIWPGWLVHMAANLAINSIGLHLFGII